MNSLEATGLARCCPTGLRDDGRHALLGVELCVGYGDGGEGGWVGSGGGDGMGLGFFVGSLIAKDIRVPRGPEDVEREAVEAKGGLEVVDFVDEGPMVANRGTGSREVDGVLAVAEDVEVTEGGDEGLGPCLATEELGEDGVDGEELGGDVGV